MENTDGKGNTDNYPSLNAQCGRTSGQANRGPPH